MIKHLFTNWKTTSAGITLIAGAVVHIVFMFQKDQAISETDVMVTIGSVLGGIGMLAAGDADKSQSKEAAKEAMEDTKIMMRGKADVEDK